MYNKFLCVIKYLHIKYIEKLKVLDDFVDIRLDTLFKSCPHLIVITCNRIWELRFVFFIPNFWLVNRKDNEWIYCTTFLKWNNAFYDYNADIIANNTAIVENQKEVGKKNLP